ncbi:MAG: hypothetical protein CL907_03515 [Dehalococcoidia bacterium]|nr:hypothetical protein [Dehalococcoidia bacterium]MEC7920630.1 ABC transporter permease [Chloroflexota bacterium]MEC9450832.1 ABC transporter permease [Chloroflexota bacterium]MQG04842.1 hypothetical protein [SAR202 cluster bacterium]|tara:strand:- start:20762 stop:21523 length:762 start_codon:yes stop_codon:yes gene_type:complete
MINIYTIFKKELLGYIKSPMAYIVAASFFTVTGFFFIASVSDAFSEASIRGFLAGAVFFLIFLSPALTMRLIAEEQKLGTMELLMTSPLKEHEIVVGKFLASFSIVLFMLAGTLFYPIILFIFGVPDFGPIFTGYLGLVLYSCSTLSIGIFASSLSSNQLVSLVVGSGILTLLTFIDFVSERVPGILGTILNELQLGGSFSVFDTSSFGIAEKGHFADFARGIISVYDIVFYLSISIIFLLSTILILETRRWK